MARVRAAVIIILRRCYYWLLFKKYRDRWNDFKSRFGFENEKYTKRSSSRRNFKVSETRKRREIPAYENKNRYVMKVEAGNQYHRSPDEKIF